MRIALATVSILCALLPAAAQSNPQSTATPAAASASVSPPGQAPDSVPPAVEIMDTDSANANLPTGAAQAAEAGPAPKAADNSAPDSAAARSQLDAFGSA